MKRAWLGLLVLVGLVGLSLWARIKIDAIHSPLETAAAEAAEAALSGDWIRAEERLRAGSDHWRRHRHAAAALGSHEIVETTESLLEQAALYARHRDTVPFAAACRSLSALCQTQQESQRLTWWNLL